MTRVTINRTGFTKDLQFLSLWGTFDSFDLQGASQSQGRDFPAVSSKGFPAPVSIAELGV